MRILIQIPQLIYGGAEKVLVNFANFLIEKGHSVEILETYEKGLIKEQFSSKVHFQSIVSKNFINNHYLPLNEIIKEKNFMLLIHKLFKKGLYKIIGYKTVAEYMKKEYYKGPYYDVAINYLETESPRFILNNINADIYLQWLHTDFKNTINKNLKKNIRFYHKFNNIICVSNTVKKSFDNYNPKLKDKTRVILNFFNKDEVLIKSKTINPYNTDKEIILSIGRLVQEKAYLRTLETMNILKKDGYAFQWYIIGDGKQREEILNQIHKLNLEKEVFLLGLKDNPYPYIKYCDIFLLTSYYEGFPTVIVEAKILKKPVITTDVSGVREQILDRETGLIVKNSQKAIYDGLKELLSDKKLRKILSDNGNIKELVNNDIQYSNFIDLINENTNICS